MKLWKSGKMPKIKVEWRLLLHNIYEPNKKQNQFKLTAADIITLRETSSLLNH